MIIKQTNLQDILSKIAEYNGNDLDLLADLVAVIRPPKSILKQKFVPNFDRLLLLLSENELYRIGLKNYVHRITFDKQISSSLSDANIITGLDFFAELKKRIIHKFLPNQPQADSIECVLVNVFYSETDGDWVQHIPIEKGVKLLNLLDVEGLFERDISSNFYQEILFAIRVLSHRITGNAFDAEVLRMAPAYKGKENPFAALQDEIDTFIKSFSKKQLNEAQQDLALKQIKVLVKQCEDFLDTAYGNKSLFGISFRVHQHLMVMETLLNRLQLILGFIVKQESEDSKQEMLKLIKTLIVINSGKSQISEYINKSTQLMAHEITQNTGKAGEHYITNSKEEYKQMLNSALGGGAIVAFACVAKMQLATVHTSIFGHGFLYSLNYAIAFTAIYLLHYTLATKQPAMTAATLARAIEKDANNKIDFTELASLFGRLFRSQFIAFVGNVFMAFPVALALVALWGFLFNVNLSAYKAPVFIKDLDFTKSALIFHSAIAGVFLFISGLISGIVHNRTKYLRIPERIIEHPILKRVISKERRISLANYYENNMGGISSNVWFGFFLGFTSTIGIILGLNLDIRHITFAAGNLALGLYGHSFNISWQVIAMSVFGIGLIGFVNFTVSFTLSLGVALRSRGVKLKALAQILIAIKNQFLQNPKSFFVPPRS